MYEGDANTQYFKDHPESQFNLDETCLTTDIVCNLVFVRRDSANAYMISPQSGKTMFTVLFCVSATGVYLPPLTIYKAKSVYPEWRQGGVPGATYACSDSGWMMDVIFENWFINVFVKYVNEKELAQQPPYI